MRRTIAHVLAAGLTVAVLAGCATSSVEPATGSAPIAGSTSSVEPATGSAFIAGCGGEIRAVETPVAVTASLRGGRVDPAPQRVDVSLGAPLVLRVEVDTPVTVHVHGYERMVDALPGMPACLEVVADVPGLFEVYSHPVDTDSETLLLQFAVR